jgi:hypothetical protein
MNNNTDTKPAFWWVNPWAYALTLEAQIRDLKGQLADEITAHADEMRANDLIKAELAKVKGQLAEAEKKRNGTCYSKATKAAVRKAAAEGLTLDEACNRYGFSRGSARTVASLCKVSFAWSGKGRKPRNFHG